ncbi:MAG: R3H domain-containing nucleic acid-binding protein [Patescibacteria group bacterium]|jgi:spoIIIJ-associated protein
MVKANAGSGIDAKVKEHLSAIFAFFGLQPEISLTTNESVLMIDITTGQDDLFTHGTADPLLALQHLLRIIARREFPDTPITLSLNIGGFQQRQRARLAEIAKDAVNQALATKMAAHLPPMSSYERRLVHLALVDETGVVGESEGEGEERRVVVKPI